jgi:hypothetical protein
MVRKAKNGTGNGTGIACAAAVAEVLGSQTPSHLMKLPPAQWALWRWFCLRGAGFPFSMVERMAAPACAEATDALLSAEDEAEDRRQAFAMAIRKQMDIAEDSQKRRKLADLLTALNKGKNVDPQDPILELNGIQFRAACDRREQAHARFERDYESALDELSEKIRQAASRREFREAMLLQNPNAARVSFMGLQGHQPGGKRPKKERQRQDLIANYLQRYCTKNDSIGFFGPVGWGRFVDEQNLSVKPGPSLVADGNIYFEHWVINALAEKLEKDPRMRPWMVPRLCPEVCLKETELMLADGTVMALSLREKAALTLCDGRRTARQLALEFTSALPNEEHTEEGLFRTLDDLVAREMITWTLEVPVVLHPEQILRNLLERIKDEHLLAEMLEPLNRLEEARHDVLRSLGDPDLLDSALARLDTVFTGVTDKPPTRHEGWNYSGRTILYQDCRRDLEIEVGAAVMERIGPPLSLLLASARWFTYESAKLYRLALERAYEEMAANTACKTIEMTSFWLKVRQIFADPKHLLFPRLLPEFQQRWEQVLRISSDDRQIQYTSASLQGRVEELFSAPRPGWPHARFHSPDVMISAASADHIRRGEYQFVLGEIHLGSNTVRPSWAMSQHPRPEEMFAAINHDLPQDQVLMVRPTSYNRYSPRGRLVLTPENSYLVEIKKDSLSWRAPSQTLPISAFVLEPGPAGLIVRTKNGALKLDMLDFFSEILSGESVNYMSPIAPRPHVPRLTIDQLVIQRESWSFAASDLVFATGKDQNERFLSARRWQKKHNMPRLVFVRVPVELKPFYVDFDSPIYVENLAKMVKRTLAEKSLRREGAVKVVEMLPSSKQLWLPDAQGNKYTCEFRIVALDMNYEQANP